MKIAHVILLSALVLSSFHLRKANEASVEKHAFQAEVSRMMKLIINSLYTNKEIFLRELISNASDALDKIRVTALTSNKTLDALGELAIRVKPDEASGTLHIMDSGIGMSKQELISNLGTIAKSGTSEFLKQNAENPSANLNDLIGQFGVGFYSSFLVADKVSVRSKSDQDPTENLWVSNSNEFSIKPADEDDRLDGPDALQRGSVITLHLKEEAHDFLKPDTLKDLIQKYSQFINFPIYLWNSKKVTEEIPTEKDEGKDEEVIDDNKKLDHGDTPKKDSEADATEDEEKKKNTKTVEKTVWDWERVNADVPIWHRKPTEEEKIDFYKSLTRDTQPPLASSHFTAEGELTFKALLFIPKVQPLESINKYGSKNNNIKLHVRRVLISDELELMPSYLAFVRGVVDSDDLPLNVGRENLQQNKLVKVIKKKLVRKTLDMIGKISSDKYVEFWKEYGVNLKLGMDDQHNRNRIAKLLLFHSSKTGSEKYTSLAEYVKNMPKNQKQILYIAGANYNDVAKSPFVERILKKGFEILYLTDAIDEYALNNLPEFDGKRFQNIAKEGLDLGDSKKSESYKKALEAKFSKLTKWAKETALKDKVHKVVVSERLSESPAALVATAFGWTGNMERLASSNAYSKSKDVTRDFYLSQKKILEVNPHHPIVKELLRRIEQDESDETAHEVIELLFATATVRSGYHLQDTDSFAKKIEKLMRHDLQVPEDAPLEEDDVDLEEDESSSSQSSADLSNDDEELTSSQQDQVKVEL